MFPVSDSSSGNSLHESAKLRDDLYAEVRIDVPQTPTDPEREPLEKPAHVSEGRTM